MVEKLVTFLEMTDPGQLRPATAVTGLEVVRLEGASLQQDRVRRLHDAVAIPHLWSSVGRFDERWRRWSEEPTRSHWVAVAGDRDVGWGSLVVDPDGDIEIRSFGIRCDLIGHGYGGAFLTELVRRAWQQLVPGRTEARATRVWLHTSSWDHPHALANYRARGFAVSRSELQEQRPGLDARRLRAVDGPPRFLVRPAVPGDGTGVGQLLDHLGYPLPEERVRDRIGRLAGSVGDLVAVATERPQEIVGFVSAHLVPMIAEEEAWFVRITALTVAPTVTRSGVGRRLIEFVEYWGSDRGAALMEVSSGRRPERAAAHAFYPALGFEDRAHLSARYVKRLPGH